MKRILLFAATLLFALTGFGQTYHIKVSLDNMAVLKTSEINKDEFAISEFSRIDDGQGSFKRIPEKPFEYALVKGGKLENILLFDDTLKPNEKLTLRYLFMEIDSPPLFPDDGAGIALITLQNTDKGILSDFTITQGDKIPEAKKLKPTQFPLKKVVDLTGHGGHLQVHFRIEAIPVAKK